MKYCFVLLTAIVAILTSCEKDEQTRLTTCPEPGGCDSLDNYHWGSICNSDTCSNYLSIWRMLFMEKNNLSKEFFDSHIEICQAETYSWERGISFKVCYQLKIDWATAYHCDQFIIKIDSNNTYYPSLNLPKETYLTKDQIKKAVDNKGFFSSIINISNRDQIKYLSMEDALQELKNLSGVNYLSLNGIIINNDNGDLTLEASAQYENEENLCVFGTIDLITGDKNSYHSPCQTN